MSVLWNPDGCCYTCRTCSHPSCREQWPSPREDESVCADCAEVAE